MTQKYKQQDICIDMICLMDFRVENEMKSKFWVLEKVIK